jgi:hypothetical protein
MAGTNLTTQCGELFTLMLFAPKLPVKSRLTPLLRQPAPDSLILTQPIDRRASSGLIHYRWRRVLWSLFALSVFSVFSVVNNGRAGFVSQNAQVVASSFLIRTSSRRCSAEIRHCRFVSLNSLVIALHDAVGAALISRTDFRIVQIEVDGIE